MNDIGLNKFIQDFAFGIKQVDNKIKPKNKNFQPGIGTFGEDVQVKMVMRYLSKNQKEYKDFILQSPYPNDRRKKLDLLLPENLAIEFKWNSIYYDNGKDLGIESLSKTICYPFLRENGNSVSLMGDFIKLCNSSYKEKKGVVFIYYEKNKMPNGFNIELMLEQFEMISEKVSNQSRSLGKRYFSVKNGLIHPIHQKLKLFGWEILNK